MWSCIETFKEIVYSETRAVNETSETTVELFNYFIFSVIG